MGYVLQAGAEEGQKEVDGMSPGEGHLQAGFSRHEAAFGSEFSTLNSKAPRLLKAAARGRFNVLNSSWRNWTSVPGAIIEPMPRADAAKPVSVRVKFTVAERRLLVRRARDAGLPLADYIRERVLAEAGCEEQVLRYLVEELIKVGHDNRRAVANRGAPAERSPSENPSAQRDRIREEVRESLTQQEIANLAEFLKPAFDAGLWPEPSDASQREES